MTKSEIASSKRTFNPRKDVWSPEVIEFFEKINSEPTVGDQVLRKVRLLCPESISITQIFFVGTNKPYRAAWYDVEVNLVGAMLFHSDSMSDAKKLLTIEDQMCRDYALSR